MTKLLLSNFQSPGDIVMLTAAVRDLHFSHPNKFEIHVQTSCSAMWDHNPHVKQVHVLRPEYKPIDSASYTHIHCHYPAIALSNQRPGHFVQAFHEYIGKKLGIEIPCLDFRGDLHIGDDERVSPIEEFQIGAPKYWVIIGGGKYDFTTKWWPRRNYQAVVDNFAGAIHFVQLGATEHWHPKLRGVTDLIGRTNLRQFLRLIYHAEGVLCPVTFAMHAAAALPSKLDDNYDIPVDESLKLSQWSAHCHIGAPLRPCVVIAGGREAPHWEAYPGHRFLHNVGSLPCCAHGGCYRNRCHKLMDNDPKDSQHLCVAPVRNPADDVDYPKCMEMIEPEDVCRAITSYYKGGVLK